MKSSLPGARVWIGWSERVERVGRERVERVDRLRGGG